MAVKTHTCHSVTCDVCGDDCDTGEYVPHFATPEEAADDARTCGWLVTADHHAICDTRNQAHLAAIDALLPPEPTTQTDGQLTLDIP